MEQHRVRFFTYDMSIVNAYELSNKEIFWVAADKFRETEKYTWIEDNSITLQYDVDELTLSWFKRITFYANLTEDQYINYALRFYKQGENWR